MSKKTNEKEARLLHDVKKVIGTLFDIGDGLEKENASLSSKSSGTRVKALANKLVEIIDDEFWGWTKRREHGEGT